MWKWLTLGSLSITTLYVLKRYFSGGVCRCSQRLNGKVVIITGANSGIGKETAYILAEKGATIILACRNKGEGLRVAQQIRDSTKNPFVTFTYLNLTSFDSIRLFVDQLGKSGVTEIYSLINNAGIFYHPFLITENNFEVTFQTNYLGPFYLTISLLNNNFFVENSRIINVVSEAHRFSKEVNVKDVFKPNPSLSQFIKYGDSKLCVHLFTSKLAAILSGVTSCSVDPGNVETNIYRNFPLLRNKFLFALQKPLRWLLVKTPRQGAQTIVHCVVCHNLSSATYNGQYLSDCQVKTPSQLAQDLNLADEVWQNSLEVCRLTISDNIRHVQKAAE